ncbi:kinase-like domain-containing protein [Suillus ampliporus]|nr:kinase-like domain-containing protein [Suillus ampliporus]
MGRDVIAIKVMRPIGEIESVIKAFCKEAVLWRQLSSEHVLPFHGVYRWPERPSYVCLVSPWMENGNIVDFLKIYPHANRCSLVMDVALGLEYLHSFNPSVVHGDLKGSNILITTSLRACVADFGLCTLVSESVPQSATTSSTNGMGALLYKAPELLDSTKCEPDRKTLKSDIYAFACVCYEIFVGHPRFFEMCISRLITAVVNDERPSRPTATQLDDDTWDLMNQCWQKNSASRPRAIDVVRCLQSLTCVNSNAGDHNLGGPAVEVPNEDSESKEHTMCSVTGHTVSFIPQTPVMDSIFPDTNSNSNPTENHDPRKTLANVTSGKSRESFSEQTSCPHTDESPVSPPLNNDVEQSITNRDIIIAVMGPTGTGKSSFINTATRSQCAEVGHDLESCTQGVTAFTYPHPDGSGRNVVFVDTPGFEDSVRTDYEVLKEIAAWLEKTYQEHVTLSGILFFHRITESRMRGTPLRNLSMFKKLCGTNALENVILTTTMWDGVPQDIELQREHQLKTQFWQEMILHGSRTARFTSSFDSAWEIVKPFGVTIPQPVQLQIEMVDEGRGLSQTSAFAVLTHWWTQLVAHFREMLRKSARSLSSRRAVQRQLTEALRQQTALNDGRSVNSSRSSFGTFTSAISSSYRRLVNSR